MARVLATPTAAADEAFNSHPMVAQLDRRDRAFARLLIYTVLRRLGEIDAAVRPHLRFEPKEREALDILRLGTAQLLFVKTPPHAAVNESIRLAGKKLGHIVPMLNAVLRRVAAASLPARDSLARARLNTPAWLLDSWIAAYGAETAAEIADAHLDEPPLDIAVKGDVERWAEELDGQVMPGKVVRRSGGGAIEELPGYAEGAWWVQDLAAGLPARILGASEGQHVLDIGAAPGGKTMQLAASGATVTALELSAERSQRLHDNLRRTRLQAEIIVADAAAWRPAAPLPFILLDAPCSATGTIRRHPDVMWSKSPDDVARQVRIQEQLLDAALEMLAPGGVLVYAVCSLQPEEGKDQAARVLTHHAGRIKREPVMAGELPGLEILITPDGDVQSLPSHLKSMGGLDGFFVARFRKI